MTFEGMLKILVNDYKKQHEEKMVSVVDELMKTRRELQEVKAKLHNVIIVFEALQSNSSPPSSDLLGTSMPTISLFVQYNGFFNELCDIRQTMTIRELSIKLRQITGIPLNHSIRLRVLSEDGLTSLFFLDQDPHRTLGSYQHVLRPRMIISIADNIDYTINPFERSKSTTSSERTYSYESDV